MSELLDLCDQYFGTQDFYEVLKINRNVDEKDIKKAYHKISLLVHPDRVVEEKKLEATEKFKVLSKIHSILSDKDKRAVYDESGSFDEHGDSDSELMNWLNYWRTLFKPITVDDIKKYEQEYIGSETERGDVKKAYLNSKGNMDYLFESVPFANCDSEPRYLEIIQKMIDDGDVPEYKRFTEEPKKNKIRRMKKYKKEQEEAEEVNAEELEKALRENSYRREQKMNNFFTELESKYGGGRTQKKRKSVKSDDSPGPAKRTRSRK